MPTAKPRRFDEEVPPPSEAGEQIVAAVYGGLLEEFELLRDVHSAEEELAAGKGRPHRQACIELQRRLAV